MNTPKGQVRFVVFGQGRTGSELLLRLLRSHPDIQCEGEVLNPYSWGRFSRRMILPLLRYVPLPFFYFRARQSRSAAYGFKLFDDHIRWPGFVLDRLQRQGWRIIHIQRRDLFAQTISTAVANQTSRWHRYIGQQIETPAIRIEPAKFLAIAARRDLRKKKINRFLAEIPHLLITYEDDLADSAAWERTSARLLAYLGFPADRILTANMVKTWEKPYSELIENYAELVAAFRSSPFGGEDRSQPQPALLDGGPDQGRPTEEGCKKS